MAPARHVPVVFGQDPLPQNNQAMAPATAAQRQTQLAGSLQPPNATMILGVLTLPSVLLNMLLAIPVYAVMRDLARWVYPSPEVE